MDVRFQLIDTDYVTVDNKPVVRLFGKTDEGKTVCVFVKNYYPYFYVSCTNNGEKLREFLKKKFNPHVQNITEIEKFIPNGFQKDKTKLVKIFLKDPSQVPILKEELSRQDFINDIYEADILFKYRFMADHSIFGMRWYRAEGKPTKTNTVKTNKAIEASKITEIEDMPNNFKYMSVDIEVSSQEGLVDARKDQISMISISFYPTHNGKSTTVMVAKPVERTGNDVQVFKNEADMLSEFVRTVDQFDPDVITGYNINEFDMPYIVTRLIENKISRVIGRCGTKHAISKKFGMTTKNVIAGRVIVDVYQLVKEMQVKTQLAEKGFPKLKRYGLGDVSMELLGEGKVNIVHSDIPKLWNGNGEQMKILIDYSRKDAELVMKILLGRWNMLDKFVEIAKVSGLLLQDVLDGGEATRIENVLLREFNKEDYVLPLKPDIHTVLRRNEARETMGLKGALVLEPAIGLHTEPVIYLDFKSMYPSIFIAYNICPTTILLNKDDSVEYIKTPNGISFVSKKVRAGIIPKVVDKLIKERDRLREEARKTQDENKKRLLEGKQIAVKYLTNSFYGYTGYSRARLYMLEVANSITACGRFLIQKTKETIEEPKKSKVIYGDTDSIMAKIPAKDLDEAYNLGTVLEKQINENLKGIVQIKIESIFRSLLILTKKRYAGLSMEKNNSEWKEKLVMKGIETIRRDWCDLTSETLLNVLQIILREQNPRKALSYIRDITAKLERNEIPVEKLVVTKSISKTLKEYRGIQPHIELLKKMRKRDISSAPGVGDRVGFVIIQGPQLMSQRAEDPVYIKEHNLKIDSRYYLENQILPPLERVFEAINIKKSELLGSGKQMSLMDSLRNGIKKTTDVHVQQHLTSLDGFACNSCSKTYRRIPLIGKCFDCGGEVLFYSGETKSRFLAL